MATSKTMAVALKPKTEITVPRIIRQKAGIKAGDKIDLSVSRGMTTISPKRSIDEAQDER